MLEAIASMARELRMGARLERGKREREKKGEEKGEEEGFESQRGAGIIAAKLKQNKVDVGQS